MSDLKRITGRQVSWALAISFLTVLFQIGVYRLTGARTVDDHFSWDGRWYASIVRNGYQTALPPKAGSYSSNVAFFPGYPLTARFAHRQLGLSVERALLSTAVFFCFLTWFYILLLMEKLRLSARLRCLSYTALISHPCSFFLITTYSESMFLALLLGYLLWGLSTSRWSWILCILHGFGMTATRIAGLSFAPLFGVQRLLARESSRSPFLVKLGRSAVSRGALVGYASCLGCLSFFLYTWHSFGHFDLYFQTGRIGWGLTPNSLVFFTGGLFEQCGCLLGRPSGARAVAWSLLSFPVLAIVEWRLYRRRGLSDLFRQVRAPIYCCCILMLYLIVSARHEVQYVSCIRYSLGWFFPQVLAIATLAKEIGPSLRVRTRFIAIALILTACIASYYYQFLLMKRFSVGLWAS